MEKENLTERPPVVVVLGHVDHGKSSLLEAIKDFKITEKESGGITQHIGAYEIEHKGKKITFIDTPGHEAFSAMRSRGAKVADIAVLVIAGEEGIKAQTKEVISHIKEFSLPFIVAINKIDKPQADPKRVKRELAQNDILVESEGGKVPSVEVSAKSGQNISELLDLISLVAEMEEIKTDLSKEPQGVVVESYLDKKRGPTATLLVKQGILKKGCILGTSSTCGKIRILEDFQGNSIEEAFPSKPVVALGFNEVPLVGEVFRSFSCLENAKESIGPRKEEAAFLRSDKKVINIILKVDVLGSLEAIKETLKNVPQDEVEIRILRSGVGDISEKDLKMAQSSVARVIGFRVEPDQRALKLSRDQKIKVRTFDVIYELVEEVRKLIEKAQKPEQGFKEIGRVEVLAIFRTEKRRQILGGKVLEGEAQRGARVEIFRNEEILGKGKVVTLQLEQKQVESLKKGKECGILFEGDAKIREGDILVIKAYG